MQNELLPEAALRRIRLLMLVLGGAGTLASALLRDWRFAASFLLGAAAAYIGIAWVERAVDALSPDAPPGRGRFIVLAGLRYAIFGAAGYVIVKVFGMNAIAAIAGLLVPVAAATAEVLYELIHART